MSSHLYSGPKQDHKTPPGSSKLGRPSSTLKPFAKRLKLIKANDILRLVRMKVNRLTLQQKELGGYTTKGSWESKPKWKLLLLCFRCSHLQQNYFGGFKSLTMSFVVTCGECLSPAKACRGKPCKRVLQKLMSLSTDFCHFKRPYRGSASRGNANKRGYFQLCMYEKMSFSNIHFTDPVVLSISHQPLQSLSLFFFIDMCWWLSIFPPSGIYLTWPHHFGCARTLFCCAR